MDFKNWLLKRKQIKSIRFFNDSHDFICLPYQCPQCFWGTDCKDAYITHLEKHLSKKQDITTFLENKNFNPVEQRFFDFLTGKN